MKHPKHWFAALAITLALAVTPVVSAQNVDEIRMFQTFLELMDSYFGIIESAHSVNSDSEKAAILQMQKIKEIYQERGKPADAVAAFRSVLKESQNPTVRNTAYMLLGDLLKDQGKTAEAAEVFERALKESVSRLGN